MPKNMSEQHMPNQYDDEIDLRELFDVLRAGLVKIIAITAIFAIGSLIYALSTPNQFKATVLLSPVESSGGGISGAIGGLASLAGVSLNGGQSTEGQIAQKIMQSWSFTEAFIKNNNLAASVYAAEGWEKDSNEPQFDSDVYDAVKGKWLVEPSSWEVYLRFLEMLSVSEDKKSGFLSVSIEYYSPTIAKQWLDLYVAAINEHMQQREMAKVTRNIQYLQVQIKKTNIAEMQEVFYKIIEEQIKNKMLAEASPDFAFDTVNPSMVPAEKSQPRRALICLLGTLLGGMLSVILVFLMHYGRKPGSKY